MLKKGLLRAAGGAADRKEEAWKGERKNRTAKPCPNHIWTQWTKKGARWKGERKYRTAKPCPNHIWTQ